MQEKQIIQDLQKNIMRFVKYIDSYIINHDQYKKSEIYRMIHSEERYQKLYQNIIQEILRIPNIQERERKFKNIRNFHVIGIKVNIRVLRLESRRRKMKHLRRY